MAEETTRAVEIRMACEERFEAWRKLLPDSRCRNRQRQRWSPLGLVTEIFCMNCGRSGGAVSNDVPDVFYVCRDCAATHGGLPVPEVPEELIRPQKEG